MLETSCSAKSFQQIQIENHVIGRCQPSFIIAEIAQAHDGSLGMAHAYIDAVAEAGVDAVKFQTHIAEAESTLDEPFRFRFSYQDKTRYDYWRRMEFSFDQWHELVGHARESGLIFLSSPFSVTAVNLLKQFNMPAWKIGSGEAVSQDILDAILETERPVLLSTGMSTLYELDIIVEKCRQKSIEFALFQCTSKYPAKFCDVGLNVIQELKELYSCPVGLSDHTGTLFPALAAIAQGADIIEAHVVFDKRQFGPDTLSSLTIEDFKLLVQAKNAFHIMNNNPVNKDKMAECLQEMRSNFSKSLAPVEDLFAGALLTKNLLTGKKPGTGIPITEMQRVIGRRLKRDVGKKSLLRWEDLNE